VAVGQDDRLGDEVHRFEALNQDRSVRTGIDDNTLLLAGRDDVGVGVHLSDDDAIDEHVSKKYQIRRHPATAMMGHPFWVTVAIAGVFFLMIPGTSAFLVRRRWRMFRRALLLARDAQPISYGKRHLLGSEEVRRLAGRLEAIQSDRTIWIGDSSFSVMVDLEGGPVFVLPHPSAKDESQQDETPRVLYWKDLSALAEGTSVFVCGTVVDDQGTIRFHGGPGGTPLVMIHEGGDDDLERLLRRAMWSGRQRNEYWNHSTPISLIGGFLAETLWAVNLIGVSRLNMVIALVSALIPALPLFPPGVIAFYWYRRVWRTARRIRARRDLLHLEGQETDRRVQLNRTALLREAVAVLLLLAGIAANAYLLAAAAALLLR
jgi:hypothetical protein